jgi:hypothetical protein
MSVETLIDSHRRAVQADEDSFDANGIPHDVQAAKATGRAEMKAFRELVRQPCADWAEVELKLTYFTTGSVGIRNTLLECLDLYSTSRVQLGADLVRSLAYALPRRNGRQQVEARA